MNRILIVSVVLLLGASAAVAQRQGPPGGDRGAWFDRMLSRIANELQLDEGQRAEFEEVAAAHRERMQSMGQRWQELRQAMRDGDEERAATLRAELEETRTAGGPFGSLLDGVEPLLRDDQLERLHAMQDRMQERRRRGETFRRVMTELPEELGLDEDQRQQWDELLAARREQRRAGWEEMRPVFEEMRAAHEAGDEARVEELRQQLEQARPNPEQMISSLLDELEGILRDDQKKILAAYRQELGIGGQAEGDEPADVRNLFRAVKRLRLEREQRQEINEIEQTAGKAWREIDRRNAEAKKRLVADVKHRILEILDDEQARAFEEQLQRLERRGRRDRG